MHWVGSDAPDAREDVVLKRAVPWILLEVHHWAESSWMVQEVDSLNVCSELVPLPPSRIPESPSPLPEQFSVLVYVPDAERGSLYGLDAILRVARDLPRVRFELVGLRRGRIEGAPANLRIHSLIPDLTGHYKRATVLWRPARHDGLSWMVLEALGHGRHVLWSYNFPGCLQVQNAAEACEQIAHLYELHQQNALPVNVAGARVVVENYCPTLLKNKILERLDAIISS
jgi:hypothetical protein